MGSVSFYRHPGSWDPCLTQPPSQVLKMEVAGDDLVSLLIDPFFAQRGRLSGPL